MADLKTELRDQIAAKIAAEHRRRAAEQIADSPEGHAEAFADAVMELFTVEEDYSSVDVRQMQDEAERTMRHRRLVAKTAWTPEGTP